MYLIVLVFIYLFGYAARGYTAGDSIAGGYIAGHYMVVKQRQKNGIQIRPQLGRVVEEFELMEQTNSLNNHQSPIIIQHIIAHILIFIMIVNFALLILWATKLYVLRVEKKRGNRCGHGEEKRNNSKGRPKMLAIDCQIDVGCRKYY